MVICRYRVLGFTLMELMIVVAVIGILGAIAYPSYVEYIYKSRRADAMNALLKLQADEEKFRAGQPSYTSTLTDLGWTTSTSVDQHYVISIDVGANANSFQARAAPKAGGAQVKDKCAVIAINQQGPVTGTPTTSPRCWNR
ncbi:MAG: hypothetical protein A2V90_03065 [Gammaproteobacteria bacterium RBG_16_57_12]|nr:MAG: hypothetical protein A2V90_03065 [Gammaproteobacteria bacterium RBG_16_57_12]